MQFCSGNKQFKLYVVNLGDQERLKGKMQDSEDADIVKTADKSKEENVKAKLSKKNAEDVATENNNVENDVTPAVNGNRINGEALNDEATTNGDAEPREKYDESTESQTAAISIENSVDDEAAETEKR